MQKNDAKQRRSIAAIAVGAVTAIILAAVAIIAVESRKELTQAARDTCALNAKALAVHRRSLDKAREEAREAARYTIDDVANGSTLETLKDAMRLVEDLDDAPTCPSGGRVGDFTKATNDIEAYADDLRNITNELDAAAKSVVDSHELKISSGK